MIAGLVLAAGRSSRLGTPKQLLPLGDRPLLQHVVDAACSADLDEVVVVLGHAADRVAASLTLPPGARVVICDGCVADQSSSLRAGLRALSPRVQAAAILLGDEPGIQPDAIRAALKAYLRTGGPVVQASYRGNPGHPVLLDRGVWPATEAVRGDTAAREVLRDHPDWVVHLEIDRDALADVDTWDDYRRINGAWS